MKLTDLFRTGERRSRALDAALGAPWAIMPGALRTILEISARLPVDLENVADWKGEDVISEDDRAALRNVPETLRERPGQWLEGTHSVEMREGVAIIPLIGPVFPHSNLMTDMSGAQSLDLFARDFTAAVDNPNVRAILIDVDSPGGVFMQVGDTAEMIFAARAKKPIVAFIGGLGCSAGYWIPAAASEVVAAASSLTGCIGVVGYAAVQEEPDQDGYRQFEIVSSNAENKRPDPRTDEGLAVIRGELDALEKEFVGAVARFRGVSANDVTSNFGRGSSFTGPDAQARGLIDRVSTFEEVLAGLIARTSSADPASAAGAQSASRVPAAASDQGRNTTQEGPMDPKDQKAAGQGNQPAAPEDKNTTPAANPNAPAAPAELAASVPAASPAPAPMVPAGTEERTRIAAILDSEEAKGRDKLARHLAFSTDMSPEDARKALSAAPKETGSSLNEEMSQLGNPEVGPGGTGADQDEATRLANGVLAAGTRLTGTGTPAKH